LTSIRVIDRSGILDCAPVLPEFRMPLAELFPERDAANGQAAGSATV